MLKNIANFNPAVVVGDHVYIDGGTFSYLSNAVPQILFCTSTPFPSKTQANSTATTTLSIDLSTSWTNSSVTINSFSKPDGVPNLDDGSLWYSAKDNALIAGFSGAAPRFNTPAAPALGLWSFKLDGTGGGTWSADAGGAAAVRSASLTRPYQGLSAYGGDIALTLGGYENDRTRPPNVNFTVNLPVPGLVTYNMSTDTFTNSSAAGYRRNGTAERGVLHYVPAFGPKGVFVVLSGDTSDLQDYNAASNIQPLSKVTVYDPSTGSFYNQTTTGNIPNGRIEFCAAGASSTNGTYEM